MAKTVQPILPSAVRRAEFGRTIWTATLPDGVTLDQVVQSDYWVHMAPKLEDLDRIEVVAEDKSFFAELLVVAVDREAHGTQTIRRPRVAVLNKLDMSNSKPAKAKKEDAPANDEQPADDELPDGYSVAYGGPVHKWRVIREGVADPIAGKMSKAEAIAWAKKQG